MEPLRALPGICDAVGHKAAIMMDGGVRRGSDVLKALALGARLVFLGRPFMYAGHGTSSHNLGTCNRAHFFQHER